MKTKNTALHEKKAADRQWAARCVAVALLNECYYRENQSGHSADNPRDYSDMLKSAPTHLSAVLSDKAALIEYRPAFPGYCKAIFALLKAALCHKKPKRFIIIGW